MSWRDLKKGDRVRLIEMPCDPNPIESGAEGTVQFVTDLASLGTGYHQIGVQWDNGRTLSLVEKDRWEKIDG
jgi:hypothetical protein